MLLYIGFIAYEESTAKYLPYFLPSLSEQTYKDIRIIAIDNSKLEINKNSDYIKNNFPEIDLKWTNENLGFAKAYNLMFKEAFASGAEYFLALNPDMILEKDFIEKILEVISQDNNIGAVQSKILKWDFENNKKTDKVDSLGITINKEHRFFDNHQGESDSVSLDEKKEIFGFTGAAVLFRLKALKDVAFDNGKYKEYFDELMFMYKEDCDLSYRLRLAGWNIFLAPEAVAYHNRTVAAKGKTNYEIALNRRSKSRLIKQWSFLNQWILLLKIKHLPFSWPVKLATAWYQLKSLVFVLLFEQYLLSELLKLWRLLPRIKARREQLKVLVDVKAIEKFMYEKL